MEAGLQPSVLPWASVWDLRGCGSTGPRGCGDEEGLPGLFSPIKVRARQPLPWQGHTLQAGEGQAGEGRSC